MSTLLNAPDPEALLEGLDPEQRQVASHVTGPMAVLAGAGTGKTRAITHRIAYGVASGAYDQTGVLAVTFTAKAAAEMRARLAKLGVPNAVARTFHAAALAQLRHFWPTAVGGEVPQILENKASLIAAASARAGLKVDRTSVRDVAAEIEWSKVNMIGAERYVDHARMENRVAPAGMRSEQFAEVMRLYEQAKRERGGMDFEDVLVYMCGILAAHQDIAREVQSRYRTFVVDEYQDVSPLQHRLLSLWLGNRKDICVVGDVAQTIYSFAGATPRYLVDFQKEHPDAAIVQLNRDYRSTPQVVAIANRVLEVPVKGGGAGRLEGAVRLKSERPSGKAVAFRTYASDVEEAESIARRVADLREADGIPLSRMAILYRSNAQSEAFETALSAQGLGVVVRGGARFFQREEIRKAIVLVRGLAHTHGDEVPLADLVTEAARGAGWTAEPPEGTGALRDRWDNLQALIDLAGERQEMTVQEFMRELDQRREAQAAPVIEGVTLSTLHAAKGLEWDVVFLAGVSEGQLPSSLSKTPEEREEERRLLYVGVTRARDVLEISWARAKRDGRGRRNRRSTLLDGIWPQEDDARSGNAAASARAQRRRNLKGEAERFAAENPPEVVALFEDLRVWRKGRADEMGKPPFMVFTDQTLRDAAVARPQTLRQLGAIRGIGDVKLEQFGPDMLAIIRRQGGGGGDKDNDNDGARDRDDGGAAD